MKKFKTCILIAAICLLLVTPVGCGQALGKIFDPSGNPFAHTFSDVATADYGGEYGVNVETLSGDKTLVCGTDVMYQYLDEGGANRTVTLDTADATAGDRFVIRHNGVYTDTHYLMIKQATTTIDMIYAGSIRQFIFNGTNWVPAEMGSGESDDKFRNVAVGRYTKVYNEGTAVGNSSEAYDGGAAVGGQANAKIKGAALGDHAYGYSEGVAIGYYSQGTYKGLALGRSSSNQDLSYAHAIGYYSKNYRKGETTTNMDGETDQENNVVQGRWTRATANNTPIEMWCAGLNNSRFTIRPSSALAFTMIIVARDNVADEVAMYTVSDGLIKRDASNNTTLVSGTVVVVHEDDAGWTVTVTADDTNEALILTVTGDAANATQWAAVLEGVETHF